jgi:hypothetical protein
VWFFKEPEILDSISTALSLSLRTWVQDVYVPRTLDLEAMMLSRDHRGQLLTRMIIY